MTANQNVLIFIKPSFDVKLFPCLYHPMTLLNCRLKLYSRISQYLLVVSPNLGFAPQRIGDYPNILQAMKRASYSDPVSKTWSCQPPQE
jgi:hypothetical protein